MVHNTLSASALTEWWERAEGEEGGRKGSGDCILTVPRSILSSLNLPSFLLTLYPIYPLSFPPRSSLFPNVLLCFVHPSTFCYVPPPLPSPHLPHSLVYPPATRLETQWEGKWYLKAPGEWAAGCALGQGVWPLLSRLSTSPQPLSGERSGV